ncbi:MAG: hypothetical protein IJE77_06700 [Thermoguttaceae bacterium]|nr:hypothetical protein [Thermoguttaceae bacterium]MBQ9800298.1 hypothetical protein [Thermoguttaceae bacterium]
MKSQPVFRVASDSTTLRSRVLTTLNHEVPEGDVKSHFSRDGRFALFTDAADATDYSNEVYVEFQDSSPLGLPLEMYVGRRRVAAGIWRTDVWLDDQKLDATGPWQTLCEEIDGDGAFLERLLPLSGGRSFSRRLFIAYKEKLFLSVDVLYGSDAERDAEEKKRRTQDLSDKAPSPILRVRSLFPLDSTESFVSQDDSAKALAFYDVASDSSPFARVFPFSATERSTDATSGTFAVKKTYGGVLETSARRTGGSLCVATLFDWNANRATRPFNFGVATVGEDLQAVDDGRAVGRQILLGRERYVLYVSTSRRPAIRSILSRNLLSDFMFGKFFVGRGVEPLVDVEIPDDF